MSVRYGAEGPGGVLRALAEAHGVAAGPREELMVQLGSKRWVKASLVEEAKRCKTWQEARARLGEAGEECWRELESRGMIRKPVGGGVEVAPEGSKDELVVLRCASEAQAREELGKRGVELWRKLHPEKSGEEKSQQTIRQASPTDAGVAPAPGGVKVNHWNKQGMFHHRGYLYFGRLPSGAVRVLKLPEDPAYRTLEGWPEVGGHYPEALVDVVVDPGSWAAIMAFVSYRPEPMENRFQGARYFHMGEEEDNRPGMEGGEPIEAKEAL